MKMEYLLFFGGNEFLFTPLLKWVSFKVSAHMLRNAKKVVKDIIILLNYPY